MMRTIFTLLAGLLAFGGFAEPDPTLSATSATVISVWTGSENVQAAIPPTIHKDANGGAFLGTSGLSAEQMGHVFSLLGLETGQAPAQGVFVKESPDRNSHFRHSWRTDLYRVDVRRWSTEEYLRQQEGRWSGRQPTEQGSETTEKTLSLLGQDLSSTWTLTGNAQFVVEDSLGGNIKFRRAGHGIKWARDEHGIIVGVTYDSMQRATVVNIGLTYILETDYPDTENPFERWHWTERRLRDRDGNLLGRWLWTDQVPPLREGARLWASDQYAGGNTGVIAEWDQELYPDGVIVLSAAEVSLLAPLDKDSKVWRSILLPSQEGVGRRPRHIGRLDFTEMEFRLWIDLGLAEESDDLTFGASMVVALPRLETHLLGHFYFPGSPLMFGDQYLSALRPRERLG